ncbi:MAG: hypothetical protein ACLUPV_05215 [Bilophila wadsworthia]
MKGVLFSATKHLKAARDPAEFGKYYLSHYFTRRSPSSPALSAFAAPR